MRYKKGDIVLFDKEEYTIIDIKKGTLFGELIYYTLKHNKTGSIYKNVKSFCFRKVKK